MRLENHRKTELNTSSMADIAFLMLTFFLMTAVVKDEKGLFIKLPVWREDFKYQNIHKRNLFTISINSADHYSIENDVRPDLKGVREEIKRLILNHGKDKSLSVSPEEAIISLKTDRGTTHKAFIAALDEIQGAYYEIYAQQAGITPEEFRALDTNNPRDKIVYEKGKKDIPMNVSIAEPGRIGF
jgi:biopolymer transport protein ExbD